MPVPDAINSFYAKDTKSWRSWLQKNGEKENFIWLILHKKESGKKTVSYEEAVEEALCFGWIDSKANKRDDESFYLSFARRNPKSSWSKLNKERVAKLVAQGKMTDAGLSVIESAKANGAWEALTAVDALLLPDALQKAFANNKKAKDYFDAFPPSTRRGILEWINNAKRAETNAKRIDETVRLAERNERAAQYTPKNV
ncbi:MAG TPA: YdeI/OmpD-associated family protein [Flavisolibacter sp.]|jgi:uncharacterized protein YdeI (YjbR/CyaY-like superfamily)|nr:YdeI/OmpD-associated family protein [Flavisolibacter sp.]